MGLEQRSTICLRPHNALRGGHMCSTGLPVPPPFAVHAVCPLPDGQAAAKNCCRASGMLQANGLIGKASCAAILSGNCNNLQPCSSPYKFRHQSASQQTAAKAARLSEHSNWPVKPSIAANAAWCYGKGQQANQQPTIIL